MWLPVSAHPGRSVRPAMAPRSKRSCPKPLPELSAINAKLESHYRDMQDVEFTIETDGCTCCRPGRKRGIQAALKIAVDMAEEGLITRDEAVCRIDPKDP